MLIINSNLCNFVHSDPSRIFNICLYKKYIDETIPFPSVPRNIRKDNMPPSNCPHPFLLRQYNPIRNLNRPLANRTIPFHPIRLIFPIFNRRLATITTLKVHQKQYINNHSQSLSTIKYKYSAPIQDTIFQYSIPIATMSNPMINLTAMSEPSIKAFRI